jgi:hypothetical protein
MFADPCTCGRGPPAARRREHAGDLLHTGRSLTRLHPRYGRPAVPAHVDLRQTGSISRCGVRTFVIWIRA